MVRRRRKVPVRVIIAVVLLTSVVLFSITPLARGAPAVVVFPTAGIVGSSATLSGTGGTPLTPLTSIVWTDSAGNLLVLCTGVSCPTTDATGAFIFSFTIPAATNGTALISASGAGYSATFATFVVISHIVLSPTVGSPGSTTLVVGTGFDSGGVIDFFTIGGVTPAGNCVGASTSGVGGFSCFFVVPGLAHGTYPVTATDDIGESNTALFTVNPGGSLAPTSAHVGDPVVVSIRGFPSFAPVEVFWDPTLPTNATVAVGFTDGSGSAVFFFAVPAAPFGSHTVRAFYSPGLMANFTVTVIAALFLTPSAGYVGQPGIAALGTGFPGSVAVTLFWDRGTPVQTLLGTTSTAANGTFLTTLTVPNAAFGRHTVSGVVGTTDYAEAEFDIVVANLTLSPTTGPPGGAFTALMAGFSASKGLNVVWDPFFPTQTNVGSGTTSTRGSLTLSGPRVPLTAVPGPHTVAAVDANGVVGTATFIVGPWITLAPVVGTVGATFVVSGWTFPAGKTIYVNWTATGPNLAVVPPLAGSPGYPYGNFTVTVTVPNFPFGTYSVRASTAGGGNLASAPLGVVPSLSAAPSAGPVGTPVAVKAQGLAAITVAVAYVDGVSTGVGVTTDSHGTAAFSFAFPPAPFGPHAITVVDAAGHATNPVPFSITPRITASKLQGYPGDFVTVQATGFAAASLITITWNGTGTTAQGTSDATGSGTITVTIPLTAMPGAYTLGAYDAGGKLAPSVSITVLALVAPVPTAPANGAFVNVSTPVLSWIPLSGGGVTYIVQISTDASFGPGTVAYSGITGTSFSLPALADSWYFWRVASVSISGGGNSPYSVAQSFLIDTHAPIATVGSLPLVSANLTVAIPFTAIDPSPGSGVAGVRLYYSTDAGQTWVLYAGGTLFSSSPISFTATTSASYGFVVVGQDRAGNLQTRGSTAQGKIVIDVIAPVASATFGGPLGLHGWRTGPVLVTLAAVGGPSGVSEVDYQLDGGNWTVYRAAWTLGAPGNHTLAIRAVSGAGVVGPVATFAVPIDLGLFAWSVAAPSAGSAVSGTAAISVSVVSPSGIAGLAYSIDGGPSVSLTQSSTGLTSATGGGSFASTGLAPGVHTLTIRATNGAGQDGTISETFRVNNPNYGPYVFLGTLVVVGAVGGVLLRRDRARASPAPPGASAGVKTWTPTAEGPSKAEYEEGGA